jgi:hypothetical protein
MRAFALLAIVVAVALAQPGPGNQQGLPMPPPVRLPFSIPDSGLTATSTCRKGTKLVNKAANFGDKTMNALACAADYEAACATPSGLVLCNNHDAVCKDSERTNDADINPLQYSSIAQGVTSQECASAGAFFHPEAWVIAPAQATVSFIVFIVAGIVAFIPAMRRVHVGISILFWGIIVTSILLLVSFYYLNAFIGVMAACIAVSIYATRDSNAIPIGMLVCALAIMWFTFDGGLGFYQHHSRLMDPLARDSANAFQETQCNQYYRFSFDVPNEFTKDQTNSEVVADGMCLRSWLAAEYFFVTLLKLELAFLVAAGGSALYA